MGLFDKVKGMLNIGGVSVQITDVENPFPMNDTHMRGAFVLTTKSDRTVLSTKVEFYQETTTGKGDEQKTSRTTLGTEDSTKYTFNDDYPFELAEGESREIRFSIRDINMEGLLGRIADKGGVLGAMGKMGSFAGKLTADKSAIVKYFVEVTADVKGTPLDPTDKFEITLAPARA